MPGRGRGRRGFGFDGDARIGALRGLKAATGEIASRFLGTPSAALEVVAVTGTNGKTSTAWWIAQALAAVGRRCGVIGTLGIGEPPAGAADEPRAAGSPTGLTTPDPITLQNALRDFVDRGVAACAIEASSIGIAEHRLAGTKVAVAVFTNFTQDHLDYHGDMRAYWQAKAQLFAWPGLRAAVVNVDDAQGLELATSLAAGASIAGRSRRAARRRDCASNVRHGRAGLAFEVARATTGAPVATPLIGDYNVANLLGVIGALRALASRWTTAAPRSPRSTPVPGRMERVADRAARRRESLPEVVVDYAHTPDALEKALAALRAARRARGGALWCVFGCGGNRDPAKRPLMGAIAGRLADHVVVTSDNPRTEAPDAILAQILAGAIGHDEVDVDREPRARSSRGRQRRAGDVVLIAGKGHEDYQEIAGVRHPFSDREAAAALSLSERTSR